jgi:serine/threonine-protein kinase
MSPERLYVDPGSTESAQTGSGARLTGDLPTDVATMASRRVGVLALIMSIAAAWGFFKSNVVLPAAGVEDADTRTGALVLVLVVSVTLLFVSWKAVLPPRRVLRIGLAYEILLCFVFGLLQNLRGYPPEISNFGMPPTTGIILIAPLLVPVAWKLRVATTASCALMYPATMVVAHWMDQPAPPKETILMLLSTVFLCAVLALVAAKIVGKMTHELVRARQAVKEMGSYEMIEMLGKGGMGEVWRARHRMLARPAAVKLIRAENLAEDIGDRRRIALTRFEREAKATATLTSPHTVQIFDFGITDDGAFYYVMELLDGQDLMAVRREHGAFSPERTIYILKQVCASLAEAHRRGMVHRDLKPNNVMICRVGGRHDFVKVLDFGLVQQRDWEVESEEGRLTVEGALLGTPAFMPPEMALGRADVDARADIYGLGCLAFWMLSGRAPLMGSTAMETILMHVQETPGRISEYAEDIPKELDAIIASCLQKDAAQRPEDAAALLELLEGVPVENPWTEARAAAWWKGDG